MTARSISSFLIVGLLLVFSVFLQIDPVSIVQAGGRMIILEKRSGIPNNAQIQPGSTPQPKENMIRPVELRLDETPSQRSVRAALPLDTAAMVELVVDDGTHFSTWGVNCLSSTAKQIIWLNRFSPDPSSFPFNLNEIWVLFDDGGGENNVHSGDAIELVVYQDNDGDPTNGANRLASIVETVQATDGSTWSTYTLDDPVYFGSPGDVILAVVNRYTEDCVSPETYPAAIDYTVNQERSWMGWWEGPVPQEADLPPDDSFSQRLGNWMIRGYGETTDDPVETPVFSQTPTQQPTLTQTATQELGLGNAYLPYVVFIWPPTPAPTNTPQLTLLYVDNQTGGELCYEVLNTGIGEKCFPEGKHFYGSFAPGSHDWKASAPCGSDSGSKDFWEGESTHSFWCTTTNLSGGDW